jgi:hemolysin activation/secretion protein
MNLLTMWRGASGALGIALLAFAGTASSVGFAAEEPTRPVELRGVVLRQALAGFVQSGVDQPGLHLEASAVVAADPVFRAAVEPLLGRPITLELLRTIAAEVVLSYRRAGRPLADAAVPAQNISVGTVQVVVLEAHLGEVAVEGARHFSSERIRAAIRTRPGEPVVAGTMFSDLDWLNENPFRRIDLVYERGADLSTTNVILRVTEQRPWQAFASYDNENVASLGRDRWTFGLRAGNLWQREHRASVLFSQSADADDYRAWAGDYVVPFPWRHRLSFGAALAEPRVRTGTFDSVGRSWRGAVRYAGELPRTRLWEIDWAVGYELKSSNNDLLFGGTTVFSGTYETHEFSAELAGRRPGPAGEANWRAALVGSPGGIGDRNSSAALSTAGRQRIGARYAYADLSGGYQIPLPAGFALGISGGARLSADRLPPSSEFALGGASLLPGYDDSAALGDQAIWGQLRLQTPVYHLFERRTLARADAIRGTLSYNGGRTAINDATPLEVAQGIRDERRLASLGLGVNYEFTRHFQLRFVYGWQLRTPSVGPGRSSRGHVSALFTF